MSFHIMRITAHTSLGAGNSAVNTWHFSADGGTTFPITDGTKTAAANVAIGRLQTFYQAMAVIGLGLTWTIGDVVTEHHETGDTAFIVATPVTTTLVAGALTAYQIAGVTSWRTALAGKQNRGRTFWGPLRTDATAFPDLTTSFGTGSTTRANNYIAACAGDVLRPCVVSTVDRTSTGGPNGHSTLITAGVGSSNCRTMRSRAS